MTLGSWLVAVGTAHAANYDVGSGQAYPTIGAAVAQATTDPGDGHVVRIFDAGPYAETVSVTEAMTIRGEGIVPLLQSIDSEAGFFTISAPGSSVTFQGLEIDGQGANRALLVLAGQVAVDGLDIHDAANTRGPGCAILMSGGVDDGLTVSGSSFRDNHCLGVYDGGSIATAGGNVTVRSSTFEGGSARDDGAHVAVIVETGGNLILEDSVFRNGVATDGGGSVYLRNGDVEIRRCTFEANVALAEGGGAFQAEAVDSLLVEDSTFIANEGFGGGGAIYQVDGTATYTRNLFCDNVSSRSGGAFQLDTNSAVIENSVFLGNRSAVDAGAARVGTASLTFRHNSLAGNSAGPTGRGQALVAQAAPGLVITDSYFGDHPDGTEAVVSLPVGAASVATSGWWANAGGTWNGQTVDLGGQVQDDSRIPAPPAGACDVLLMLPPSGSPLSGAASDGTAIGAFGGPSTWPDSDADGWLSLQDCDDHDGRRSPGASEVAADGIDQDCDGADTCYADTDGDGFGDATTLVVSAGAGCTGPGEAAKAGEVCEGSDDALDADLDQIPDGCDGKDPDSDPPESPERITEAVDVARPGCGCASGGPADLPLLVLLILGCGSWTGRRRAPTKEGV